MAGRVTTTRMMRNTKNTEAAERRANIKAHARAYDSMCASRPLKPPPMRLNTARASAGAVELAKEKRTGVYDGRTGEMSSNINFGHFGSGEDRGTTRGHFYVMRARQ